MAQVRLMMMVVVAVKYGLYLPLFVCAVCQCRPFTEYPESESADLLPNAHTHTVLQFIHLLTH